MKRKQRATEPKGSALGKLILCSGMDDVQDFFALFAIDADRLQRLSCSAVRTDERTVIFSGKGGFARELLSAARAGLRDVNYF